MAWIGYELFPPEACCDRTRQSATISFLLQQKQLLRFREGSCLHPININATRQAGSIPVLLIWASGELSLHQRRKVAPQHVVNRQPDEGLHRHSKTDRRSGIERIGVILFELEVLRYGVAGFSLIDRSGNGARIFRNKRSSTSLLVPLPSADQLAPFHLAIRLTDTPPAMLKSPPAKRSVPITARAPRSLSTPVPSADQLVPFHLAIRFALVPPAEVKSPPTKRSVPLTARA